MILEIATFFADLARYDRSDDRYDICGVMGPDEYHDALPGAEHAGLDESTLPPPETWGVEVILRYEVSPRVTTVPLREGVASVPPEQAPEETEPGDVKLEEPPGMESPGG